MPSLPHPDVDLSEVLSGAALAYEDLRSTGRRPLSRMVAHAGQNAQASAH